MYVKAIKQLIKQLKQMFKLNSENITKAILGIIPFLFLMGLIGALAPDDYASTSPSDTTQETLK